MARVKIPLQDLKDIEEFERLFHFCPVWPVPETKQGGVYQREVDMMMRILATDVEVGFAYLADAAPEEMGLPYTGKDPKFDLSGSSPKMTGQVLKAERDARIARFLRARDLARKFRYIAKEMSEYEQLFILD